MIEVFRYGPLEVGIDADTGKISFCRSLIPGLQPRDFSRFYINAACIAARQHWESRYLAD